MQQYVHASTNNLDVQNLDFAVAQVFDSLMPNPLLNSPRIVNGLIFVSGTTLIVSHGLGRTPKGYIIIGLNAAAIIYSSSPSNPNTAAYINLESNADVTANILFF